MLRWNMLGKLSSSAPTEVSDGWNSALQVSLGEHVQALASREASKLIEVGSQVNIYVGVLPTNAWNQQWL